VTVVEIEPAEPPVGKVQLNLLAQPSFKADAVAVTHKTSLSFFLSSFSLAVFDCLDHGAQRDIDLAS
jgi:hypothetical protein